MPTSSSLHRGLCTLNDAQNHNVPVASNKWRRPSYVCQFHFHSTCASLGCQRVACHRSAIGRDGKHFMNAS